jgi:hypothetical protein
VQDRAPDLFNTNGVFHTFSNENKQVSTSIDAKTVRTVPVRFLVGIPRATGAHGRRLRLDHCTA